MRPRYKKVINDIKADWRKSLLLVLAIAIGVFGIGAVFGAYGILNREMDRNYMGTHPAHATIVVDKGLEPSIVERVKGDAGVKEAEMHGTVVARMRVGGDWYRLLLFVVNDFDAMRTNTFTRVSGAWPPPEGTMLVERTSFEVMRTIEGGTLDVKLPEGKIVHVTLSGTVHDPGLAPSRQEQTGYGYISPATYRRLGGSGALDQLRIITSAGTMKEAEQAAARAAAIVKSAGYTVHEVQVPPLNRHPHSTQMNAILALLAVFALLLLVLGSVLVTSAISVVMLKQVREIGVMKTIGAGSRQIAGMYFFMIAAIAALATGLALAPATYAAAAYADAVGRLLNFTIYDHAVPAWVFTVQMSAGMVIPLAVAARSVMAGSRTTIREAITDYGVRQDAFASERLRKFIIAMRPMGTTLTLSFRNLFRHHARLVVALTLLAAAGAMFTTSLNIAKAWSVNLEKIYTQRHYDIEVRFSQPFDTSRLAANIRQLGGIRMVESWGFAPTSFAVPGQFDITHIYPDTGHGSFSMLGVPDGSRAVDHPLLRGTWLTPGKDDEVVLNHMAAGQMPGVKPGDTVSLSIDGAPGRWRVAGIVEDIGSPLMAYVSASGFGRVAGTPGKMNMLRIAFDSREPGYSASKVRQVEDLLYQEGVPVSHTLPTNVLKNAIAEHMGILVAILLAMAALMGIVGAIGLMSTISMNIMERTRELGVMRAIGAPPNAVSRMLLAEGLVIGLASIPFAFMAAIPLSFFIGRLIGQMAFRTPLPLAVSYPSVALWVAIVIAGSVVATLYPAWKAGRIPVREALAYE